MSVTEEQVNLSWNLPAINTTSAVDDKNRLIEVGMAPSKQSVESVNLLRQLELAC
jgi:hypothetical protein